jgi:hypothetical protein
MSTKKVDDDKIAARKARRAKSQMLYRAQNAEMLRQKSRDWYAANREYAKVMARIRRLERSRRREG